MDAPNVITDGRLGELGTIRMACVWVEREWGSCSVRRAKDVGAEDEEAIGVKRFSAAHERTPPGVFRLSKDEKKSGRYGPIFDIGTAGEGMADDHDVVSRLVETAPCFVCDWDVSQKATIFERKRGDDVNGLVEDGRYDGHEVVEFKRRL